MTATTTPTRATSRGNSATKAPKAVRKETAKEMTAAQKRALETLVSAATSAIQSSESEANKAREYSAQLVTAADASADFKVYAARAMARLSAHPAMVATRGTGAGTPALTKMATLMGRKPQSLETYWKAAKALISKGWDKRTAAPKPEERALVGIPFKDESARVTLSAKNKGTKTAPKKTDTRSTTITVDTINGQLDAVLESVQKFAASFGFTDEQAKAIFGKLDAVTDVVENATAKK